jgi:enoyl-CoA hydratase/carnithine racemase
MSVLLIERSGSTAVVTMNRPAVRNALDLELRRAFADALPMLRDDDTIRSVVLTGANGHFCAGSDLRSIDRQQMDANVFAGRDRVLELHRWFDELVELNRPVIAAVDGVAYGAGFSLALGADFVMASPRASFCAVFARIGLVPDVGMMYLLPRVVGLGRAKELAFSARVLSADEARDLGIVQEVVRDGTVLEAALKYASRFDRAPTAAIGLAKSVLNRAFESDRHDVYMQEALAQALCLQSAFHQEATERFLNKQPLDYRWPDPAAHAEDKATHAS